jgi:hypothetical protein
MLSGGGGNHRTVHTEVRFEMCLARGGGELTLLKHREDEVLCTTPQKDSVEMNDHG